MVYQLFRINRQLFVSYNSQESSYVYLENTSLLIVLSMCRSRYSLLKADNDLNILGQHFNPELDQLVSLSLPCLTASFLHHFTETGSA